jgi:hypothetical protein
MNGGREECVSLCGLTFKTLAREKCDLAEGRGGHNMVKSLGTSSTKLQDSRFETPKFDPATWGIR